MSISDDRTVESPSAANAAAWNFGWTLASSEAQRRDPINPPSRPGKEAPATPPPSAPPPGGTKRRAGRLFPKKSPTSRTQRQTPPRPPSPPPLTPWRKNARRPRLDGFLRIRDALHL